MAFSNAAYNQEDELRPGRSQGDQAWVREIELTRTSPTERGIDTKVDDERVEVVSGKPSIGVLGSGDFGRALAGRLAQAGYTVYLGSRDPTKNRSLVPSGVELTGLELACLAPVIIAAIPKDYYHTLPAQLLAGRILVDCSNRKTLRRTDNISQAEYLASLYPEATVVKAFNVLSAYALESGGIQGSKQVYVAGDASEAREVVCGIVRGAGFTAVDLGGLTAARVIEDIPVAVFPSWRVPFIINIVLFVFLYALSFAKFQICWPLTWSDKFLWELWNHIPMDNVNKTLAVHALVSLALCYLPGVIAAWLQIFRGTKYSRFPNWLDQWLRMRKQLGLLMLFAACIHACLSLAYMSPTYQDIVFGQPKEVLVTQLQGEGWGPKVAVPNTTVKVYGGDKMDWRGECFLITGVFGFALVLILGISSLPSVTATLSWKEFAFIQSGLGWASLLFLCAHDMFYGWPYINGPSCGIPSSFQYALYIPGLTILLKLPLVLPPLSCHLDNIRGGYVRGGAKKATTTTRDTDSQNNTIKDTVGTV